jgi:hypothetical protein
VAPVSVLRRKRLPPSLQTAFEQFLSVVAQIEAAKADLTACVPSTRFAGRPLTDGLASFQEHLVSARKGMSSWRRAEVEEAWQAASSALEEAERSAERVRLQAPDPGGFEGLIGLIDDLLAPFDAFEEAFERFARPDPCL